jgi:hypothetical protein
MKQFYTVLPTIAEMPSFYVRGYTESLKLFTGVRVVPSVDFLTEVPYELRANFHKVGFPCYFIPIIDKQNCYGFVLKGVKKFTPVFCTNFRMPGLELVKPQDTVCIVEGFKDAYLLLASGIPTLPSCKAMVSKKMLSYLQSIHCRVLFIPDNDKNKQKFSEGFIRLAKMVRIAYKVFDLQDVGDLGEFFDDPSQNPYCRQRSIEQVRRIREVVKQWV